MKKIILVLAMLLLMGIAIAEQVRTNADVWTTNADGEIIVLFGPVSFNFDDGQFPNPVTMRNGTAVIGGIIHG